MIAQERRRFPRLAHALDMRYRLAGGVGEPWCGVQTMNLSASGIRFRGDEALDQGAMLELQMTVPEMGPLLSLRGAVVWTQLQASGVNELGVQFLDLTPLQQSQIDRLVRFLQPGG